MRRLALILAASWLLAGSSARAGELDSEFGGKAKAEPAASVEGQPSGELDGESPDQACRCGWRRRGFGYGGYGFYGRGYYGYRGFGYGRGYGYRRWWW